MLFLDVLKRRTVSAAANLGDGDYGDENRPEASISLSIASVLQLLSQKTEAKTNLGLDASSSF